MNAVKKKSPQKRNFGLAVIFLHCFFASKVFLQLLFAEARRERVLVFIFSFSSRTMLRIVKALHCPLSLSLWLFFPSAFHICFSSMNLFIYLFACLYVSQPACSGYSEVRWRDRYWMREESLGWLVPVRVYNDKNRPTLGTWIFNLMRASLFFFSSSSSSSSREITILGAIVSDWPCGEV